MFFVNVQCTVREQQKNSFMFVSSEFLYMAYVRDSLASQLGKNKARRYFDLKYSLWANFSQNKYILRNTCELLTWRGKVRHSLKQPVSLSSVLIFGFDFRFRVV